MVKVKIWGTIRNETSDMVETALSSLKDDVEPVIMVINSNGGSYFDALAITNLMDAIPNPIITIAFGMCASAAAMIFAHGYQALRCKRIIIYDSSAYVRITRRII